MFRHVVIWCALLCTQIEISFGSETRHFKWEVESMFGTPCLESMFGTPCLESMFGTPCSESMFGTPCWESMFGTPCWESMFGTPCWESMFGTPCSESMFGTPCWESMFGTPCLESMFGTPCWESMFGTPCLESMFGTPDCIEHAVVGTNGQFPGPTVRAKAGDTIAIELTNKLHTEGVVIHWHGIRQLGTPIPWADGTASISEYTINPGETILYRFKVNKAGTYFYHVHYGMQRSVRLYGSLIVEVGDGPKEPLQYDGEFNLLLSDWGHHQEVELSKPFRGSQKPRKLLNDQDKELGENKASVHGSVSKPSPSEEATQDYQGGSP